LVRVQSGEQTAGQRRGRLFRPRPTTNLRPINERMSLRCGGGPRAGRCRRGPGPRGVSSVDLAMTRAHEPSPASTSREGSERRFGSAGGRRWPRDGVAAGADAPRPTFAGVTVRLACADRAGRGTWAPCSATRRRRCPTTTSSGRPRGCGQSSAIRCSMPVNWGAPDWSVLTLTGSETAADERERIWFTWTATVAVRPHRGRACDARPTR
jgi:hypothetical protein